MRIASPLSALAASLVLALPALAADVAGKWTTEFDSQIGKQKYTFDLKVDGETVTGKAHFERAGQTGDGTGSRSRATWAVSRKRRSSPTA
jgi:hypothetical protein